MRASLWSPMLVVLSIACVPPAPPTPPHPAAPETAATSPTPDAPAVDDAPAPASEAPTTSAPSEPVAPEPTDPLAELEGEYRYASGKKSVGTSIDHVVDEMSVFVRGIAKKRLTAANGVPKRLAIAREADSVTVSIDGRAYAAELGGSARSVRDPHGEKSRMKLSMHKGSLYQTFTSTQGVRTNVFTPRAEGGVVMAVRISSKQLPSDVVYRLAYADS